MWLRPRGSASDGAHAALDVERLRRHFEFPRLGRIVTNNAASTQPPRELLELVRSLTRDYENVHRGQSSASRRTTHLFESAYDTFAEWVNAPSRRSIATYRNTTEAINAVMYSQLTEFRDGDNVVTTMMEHNSNFVPWYGLCHELLPRFGRRVQCRVARFDHHTGALDLDHLARLVDERTRLVCVTGASNFLGTKPPLDQVRAIADRSGYVREDGRSGSLLLVDAAQLLPSSHVDVRALDVDYLAFSCHKLLAPFGVGVLYAKEHLLSAGRPFLYGGDMIADGMVAPDRVEYNDLPWKYAAGTPNILGVIASAQALRLLLDLADPDRASGWFGSSSPVPAPTVQAVMSRVSRHVAGLTDLAMQQAASIEGLSWFGPPAGVTRAPLLAFTVEGVDPFRLAEGLDRHRVEARAGCHCATLAHHDLGLTPPASCRLSFAVYTSRADVLQAMDAVRQVVSRLRAGSRVVTSTAMPAQPAPLRVRPPSRSGSAPTEYAERSASLRAANGPDPGRPRDHRRSDR